MEIDKPKIIQNWPIVSDLLKFLIGLGTAAWLFIEWNSENHADNVAFRQLTTQQIISIKEEINDLKVQKAEKDKEQDDSIIRLVQRIDERFDRLDNKIDTVITQGKNK